ncbi:MAG TPA: hypothetical protein VJ826_14620 [Candidatus Polarisedimenticolaceae bacterium]|nr:hypothetical protein [Candidatus Polarisedimenticolaceae bacterium]
MKSTLAALLMAGAVTSARAGGLAIVGTELRDNGDHDGYADTNETVELWLTVKNTTAQPLTGVTASISLNGAPTVCIVDGTASIGDVAAGATIVAPEPFVFHVGVGQDRALLGLTPTGALTATFDLGVIGAPASPIPYPSRFVFDLDLDAPGSGASTTIVEDFESGGFGLFTIQNLDFGLHTPATPQTGPVNGYRCQYYEPYCHTSTDCDFSEYVPGGTAAAADGVWWQIDARGYSGTHALYFGQALGPVLGGYTTPNGVLEAVGTTAPIALVNDPTITPTLTFMHQMSFVDYRAFSTMLARTCLDRGIVSIQQADASGAAAGPWLRLEPSVNVHDQLASAQFVNVYTFDPIDDGNDGDQLYPPWTPGDVWQRRGPSSTCADERVFAWMGSTTGAYDPLAVGGGDGPGLAGASGPGTWVETSYDLSRYRGRSVRIRFLATTTRFGSLVTWKEYFGPSSVPYDDGWWIDDVTVSGAAAAIGPVTNDVRDNSALTVDADADGADDRCDDNCVGVANGNQADLDADTIGDSCDLCTDTDGDGFGNPGFPATTCALDNCPFIANPTQADADLDGDADACDNCPAVANADQENTDEDPAGNACDCAPSDAFTYPGAPERNDGLDNNCPGDREYGIVDEISGAIYFDFPSIMSWPEQSGANGYTVVRLRGTTFATINACLVSNVFQSGISVNNPPAGVTSFYLVRSYHPRIGSWGYTSAGVPRYVGCASPP